MSTSFRQRKTPGVYITELDAFPKSIVGVQTAVPAFIGYTEKATVSGKPVYFKPIPIGSLADYQAIFGAGFVPNYNIEQVFGSPASSPPPADSYDFVVLACESLCSPPLDEDAYYEIVQTKGNESTFNLYNSLRLFYANGGGNCYIVSVGDYTDQGSEPGGVKIDPEKLKKGLKATADQTGPTMLVIPDAVLLERSEQFYDIAREMLKQCFDTQDRVAILDVYDTETLDQDKPGFNIALEKVKTDFYEGVGDKYLNYGMAYFPFLNSSVVQPSEILYTNFDIGIPGGATTTTLTTLQDDILTVEAQRRYGTDPVQYGIVSSYIRDIDPDKTKPTDTVAVTKLNQNLVNALPILGQIENVIASKIDLLPPSGAMAGVFTFIDQTRGVWNAPANTTLASVVSPTIKLNNEQQGELNKPLNGKAIDVIRQFPGRGSVVWGARTLDGNSNDWRYIQVRRTLVYVEQSIKLALDQFVFAANDGKTWVGAVSMVSNFLQGLWSQGGLMGATATEAFTVECGLGSTMTPLDILEGYMIVQVTLQMIHPAEFIELTFKQKMAGQA